MENLHLYVLSMYSVMPGTCIFRFKVAMAANSKMAAIWLRKILNIYIKQWLAINQLNDIQVLIRYQKWFRLIVFDIGSKMVTKLKIAAVSRKKYMLIQNTYDLRCCEKVIILNVLYILKGGDTLKGLLLHVCLTIAYLSCGRHKWRLISPPPISVR